MACLKPHPGNTGHDLDLQRFSSNLDDPVFLEKVRFSQVEIFKSEGANPLISQIIRIDANRC